MVLIFLYFFTYYIFFFFFFFFVLLFASESIAAIVEAETESEIDDFHSVIPQASPTLSDASLATTVPFETAERKEIVLETREEKTQSKSPNNLRALLPVNLFDSVVVSFSSHYFARNFAYCTVKRFSFCFSIVFDIKNACFYFVSVFCFLFFVFFVLFFLTQLNQKITIKYYSN